MTELDDGSTPRQPAAELAEIKARWLDFGYRVAFAMIAGEISAAYYVAGDVQRAQAEAYVAIGEAASLWSGALSLQEASAEWRPVCDLLINAAKIHVASLEQLLSTIRRRARLRSESSRSERKKGERLAGCLVSALEAVRARYGELGGAQSDIVAFTDLYTMMKAEGLRGAPTLSELPPAWGK
jgi:hypothetical protein